MIGNKLCHLREDDYLIVAEWLSDPIDMTKTCGNTFEYPLSREAFINYFTKTPNTSKAERLCYKYLVDNRAVGMCSYMTIDWKNNNAHIGYVVVAPTERRNGIGSLMLNALLYIGFETYGLNRIDLFVLENNEEAYQFYINKVGFKDEGLIREIIRTDTGYLSWNSLSILASEWKDNKRYC